MDKLAERIAWLLPRRVLYWATVRVFAIATTGEYAHRVASELTVFEAQAALGVK